MENTLFKQIIGLMNNVEKMLSLDGEGKKRYVLIEIRKIITDEAYERYEPMIIIIIDGLIDVSRKKITMHLNKRKLCLSCVPK